MRYAGSASLIPSLCVYTDQTSLAFSTFQRRRDVQSDGHIFTDLRSLLRPTIPCTVNCTVVHSGSPLFSSLTRLILYQFLLSCTTSVYTIQCVALDVSIIHLKPLVSPHRTKCIIIIIIIKHRARLISIIYHITNRRINTIAVNQ